MRYKDRTWSLATEYQWVVTNDLDLVGAISYDWRDSLETDKGADDNKQTAFNWEMMAKYSLTNNDTVRFSVSDRSRFPTQKNVTQVKNPKMALKGSSIQI